MLALRPKLIPFALSKVMAESKLLVVPALTLILVNEVAIDATIALPALVANDTP